MINSKERVQAALSSRQADRCPMQLSFTPEFAGKLRQDIGEHSLLTHNPHGGGNDHFLERTLGAMFYKGQSVSQDYKKAVHWFTKAAEQNHVIAQSNLGLMYAKGQGVNQDYEVAAKWLKMSAEK